MLTTTWHNRYNLNYRLKTTFRRKFNALKKKNAGLNPYTVTTKTLAFNWWAKAWNAHLKNLAPNTIQLEKGKLNFRCEALADLKIKDGIIQAIVLGSKIQPYTITITIAPLSQQKWTAIQKSYNGNLELFEKILDNHFPKEMGGLFKSKSTNLLPSVSEIDFNCSCSERKTLCKHTAVVLFALGTKMDEDPQLIFKLRGVNILEFIANSIHDKRNQLLEKAKSKKLNILKESDLSEIFHLELSQ